MDPLCPDMLNHISTFLSNAEVSNLSQTSKRHYEILTKELQQRKKEKIDHIRRIFPKWLIDLVSIDKFISLPYLEWNNEWLGGTDYIDRIKYGTSSSPMWYTVDLYRRSAFILDFKAVIYNDDGETKEVTNSICIFQRYTNGSGYTCGTYHNDISIEILCHGGMINPNEEDNLLLKIIKDGELEYIHNKDGWFNKKLDRIVYCLPTNYQR